MRGGKNVAKKLAGLGYKVEFLEEEDFDREEVIEEIEEYKAKYEEKHEENPKEEYTLVIERCQELLSELETA